MRTVGPYKLGLWECKMMQSLWKIVWQFFRWLELPAVPLLVIHPRKMKTCTSENLYVSVYSSIIHNNQDGKWPKCLSTDNGSIKHGLYVFYIYNGISFTNKKEWGSKIYFNMTEPGKHYAKWKKPDTKGHIWFHL